MYVLEITHIMAENGIDFNALGQALDSSWGRSSTPKTASYSVKVTMVGPDRLLASYQAIVNFGTEKAMIEMKRNYVIESESVTNAVMKHTKEVYKDLTGTALKAKEIAASDSLEIIGMGVHNPNRKALYRRRTVFEIG